VTTIGFVLLLHIHSHALIKMMTTMLSSKMPFPVAL